MLPLHHTPNTSIRTCWDSNPDLLDFKANCTNLLKQSFYTLLRLEEPFVFGFHHNVMIMLEHPSSFQSLVLLKFYVATARVIHCKSAVEIVDISTVNVIIISIRGGIRTHTNPTSRIQSKGESNPTHGFKGGCSSSKLPSYLDNKITFFLLRALTN